MTRFLRPVLIKKMSSLLICTVKITSGVVFKNFMKAVCANSLPHMEFAKDQGIIACNETADGKIFVDARLDAEEIAMAWNDEYEHDQVIFRSDSDTLKTCFDRVVAKDNITLRLFEMYHEADDVTTLHLQVSQTLNQGDDRESLKNIMVHPSDPSPMQADDGTEDVPTEDRHVIRIPGETLKGMIKSFSKVKSDVEIAYVINDEKEQIDDKDLLILRKCGDMTVENTERYGQSGSNEEIRDDALYVFSRANYNVLLTTASMHKEGLVHIYHYPGKSLRIRFRIGCFGEINTYIRLKTPQ